MFSPPVSGLAAGVGPMPGSRGSPLTPLDGLRPIPVASDGALPGAGMIPGPGSRVRSATANNRPSPLASSGRMATAPLTQATNLSEADNIKVAVRVRPLFSHETEKGGTTVVQVNSNTTIKVVVPGPAGTSMQRDFAFHACLGPEVNQADVLHLCGVPQLLDAALAGYNVTVFAYGQTGSGKTYTMSGREEVISSDSYTGDSHDGIITRAIQHLFATIEAKKHDAKYAVSASYLEIYNEGIFDLLNLKAKNLPVKWDATLGFFVPGLKQVSCTKVDTMMEVIRTGMKHRHVGSHELNIESSRSHSIMTIFIHVTPTDPSAADFGTPRIGKVSFVDLAGSERLKDTKSEGAMLKETTNINKSLFVLGKVISALAERDSSGTSAHIPYRDSKLTKLLMDSLGGNALALMIACCSPASTAVEETLSTLSYATRAKNIQNRPTVQYDPKEAQIANLRREIELLRQENTYLREQIRMGNSGGGLGVHHAGADLSASIHTGRPAWPPGSAGGGAACTSDREVHIPWPGLTGADGSGGGSRDSSRDSARDSTPPSAAAQHAPLPGPGPGPGPHLPPPAPRLVAARVVGSAEGALRSTAAPPSPGHLEPLRMSVDAATSAAGAGGVGSSLARRLSHAGPVDDDLMRRLMETQSLLARFSEENGRLAKENDRLRAGRQLLSQEHGEVLDEIEMLRGKLIQLESAVLSGTQTPNAAKAALHSAITGSAVGGARPRADSPNGGGPGSPPVGLTSTPPLGAPYGTSLPPHSAASALPGGQPWAVHHAHDAPPGTGMSMAAGMGAGMGMGMGMGPAGMPYQTAMPPASAGGGAMPYFPPGSAVPVPMQHPMQMQGGGPGGMPGYGLVPGSAPPALHQHPAPHPHPQPQGPGGGVANVMAVGPSPGGANAARTRTKYGAGGGGPASNASHGDDSIIVADRNKLALLLGDGPIEPAVPVRPLPIKPPEPSYANAAKSHHAQHIQKQLQRGGSNPSSPTGAQQGR